MISRICSMLILLLLNVGCSSFRFVPPGQVMYPSSAPSGYRAFQPRYGYIDKAAYISSARHHARGLFRDFDSPAFELSGVYISNYAGSRIDRRLVLVDFTRIEPRKTFPMVLPDSPPTTTLRYELSCSGRVLAVTRRHDDWEGWLADMAAVSKRR